MAEWLVKQIHGSKYLKGADGQSLGAWGCYKARETAPGASEATGREEQKEAGSGIRGIC